MSNFEIPKFRYISQDLDGGVYASTSKPRLANHGEPTCWIDGGSYFMLYSNEIAENSNWQNTLIDLETDDYTFENGILSRVEK